MSEVKATGNFKTKIRPDEDLAKITGPEDLSNSDMVKKFFAYVKRKNLRVPI